MEIISIHNLSILFLLTLGLTYIITGSVAGYRIRLIGCWFLGLLRLKRLWPLLQCPPCNAFWTGLGIGWLFLRHWEYAAQVAVVSCGLIAVLQSFIGGSGIAADEDFEDILGGKE
jgi:hypothetical protein